MFFYIVLLLVIFITLLWLFYFCNKSRDDMYKQIHQDNLQNNNNRINEKKKHRDGIEEEVITKRNEELKKSEVTREGELIQQIKEEATGRNLEEITFEETPEAKPEEEEEIELNFDDIINAFVEYI